jgi:predicted RNase H-like nuclease (RuvC/YqgF family)
MPENKYMSHSDTNCKDAKEMARRAMGGGMANLSQQVCKYKKESKALMKKLSKMQSKKKNKKLSKMSKKKSSDKEIRKLRKKLLECISSSDESEMSDGEISSSASSSDSD